MSSSSGSTQFDVLCFSFTYNFLSKWQFVKTKQTNKADDKCSLIFGAERVKHNKQHVSQRQKKYLRTCALNENLNQLLHPQFDQSIRWPYEEILQAGPSCSKLTMSLVNDSLKFTSSETQIYWNILQCKSYSHFFSKKYQHIVYWIC